jgi:hypothetical protein
MSNLLNHMQHYFNRRSIPTYTCEAEPVQSGSSLNGGAHRATWTWGSSKSISTRGATGSCASTSVWGTLTRPPEL